MMTLRRSHLYIVLAVSIVGVPLVACDDGTTAPTAPAPVPTGPTTQPTTDPTTVDPTGTSTAVTPPPTAPSNLPPRNVDGVVTPVRPLYQTKSAAQLRKSIIACFGTNSTTVTAGMIVGGGAPNLGGLFFSPGTFVVGDDVVNKQVLLFDGDADSTKVGVRGDQLTLEYLTALRNVANVVGFRCLNNLVDNPAMCACDNNLDASAMLQRCIGDVVPPTTVKFQTMTADFSAACTNPPAPAAQISRGVAVASLVSSLTFAKLP